MMRTPLWVAPAYLVLILVFTWPLPANLGGHLVLDRGSDVWQHVWNFAWVRTALLDLHQSPYFTHSIFYPAGVPLAYHALNVFSATVSIPLQALFGLIPAFNLLLLGNLLAAALATYWLARVLGLNRPCAFVAGLLFACSPPLGSSFDHGQGELVSVFWMPLYAGLLLRGGGLRALGLPPGPRRYLVLAGVALFGSALAIWYWFVSLLVFTAVYALLEAGAAARASGWRAAVAPLARLALVGASALILLAPLALLLLRAQIGSGAEIAIAPATSDQVILESSQDLLAFFLPLPARVDLAQTTLHGAANLGIGWTVLALAGAGLVLRPRAGAGRAGLWLAAALAFAVLALGPALIVDGQNTHLPLPYAAILQLPGAAAMRVPLRFCTPLALCLAVLAAQGLAALQARLGRAGRAALPPAAVLLAGLEFFAVPRPLILPEVQPFFQQLARAPSPCDGVLRPPLSRCAAVLELPQDTWAAPGMFHEAVDHHPMIGGYTSRHYDYPFVNETPGVAQLVNADTRDLGTDILSPPTGQIALRAMDYYGVRYVVVHSLIDYHPAPELRRVLQLLFPAPGTPDGELTIYTVPPVTQDRAFFFFGQNWYRQEPDGAGGSQRWTDTEATLHAVAPPGTAGTYTLALQVYSVGGTRTLVVALDGRELARAAVGPTPGRTLAIPLTLAEGEHTISLASLEPAVQPRGDRRYLSLGYRAVALRPAP